MKLTEDEIYHIYNQGNNKQQIFFKTDNYLYFLRLVQKHISPYGNILAYCLMPNHFHFLIHTTPISITSVKHGNIEITNLSNGFRRLQSSYTQAINKQEKRSGSLFRQNTKAKLVSDNQNTDYSLTCLHYIHQNPLKAGLVTRLENWEYSSFNEFMNGSEYPICNKEIADLYFNISPDPFYKESYTVIEEESIKNLF